MADDKNYPKSSDEMKSLLGLGEQPEKSEEAGVSKAAPENLPFMPIEDPVRSQQTAPVVPSQIQHPLGAPAPAGHTSPLEQLTVPAERKGNELYAFLLKLAKAVLPYIVIFAIGLGLFYFFFSDFSVNSLFSNKLRIQDIAKENQNKEVKALQKDLQGEYVAWMRQFFFDVNDEAIISMDTDVSGNGLSNFEKFLLNL